MKRTLIILAAAAFIGTTMTSCSKDLCAAYAKEHKTVQKKKDANS